ECEPTLHLADAATPGSHLGGPLVGNPLGVLADEGEVGGAETGFLLDFAPHRIERLLALLDAPLGELPAAGGIAALEGEDGSVAALDHGHDAGAEVSGAHRRAG